MSDSPTLSIVVPMFNEQDNVRPMVERVHAALAGQGYDWELILVDDGSTDETRARMLAERERHGAHLRLVQLARNFGQTAAMQAGIDHAQGDVIAFLDGDLQNDPADIPAMVQRLIDEDLDLVAGWRRSRQDALWQRKIPSMIANRLIRKVTGVVLHDYGCSLKVFRAEVIKEVRLYGEMHRFIPAWIATRTTPARIAEQVVNHYPRAHGTSKYGISRTFRVIIDLLSVYFFLRYRARPGHFFGSIGLFFGALGGLALLYLFFIKLFLGASIGDRPLLIAGVMCVLVSVQMLTTGVLSELLARTWFESGKAQSYVVRRDKDERTAFRQEPSAS
ncbi:MAG: glycosyltransferase family 2 protein [Chromatiales bacterium]|jgi:glycosyltransferase involved in cell wall biosynthesis|nr:glycosyltransferase family 2 protein [Chromatiales bacterium]MDX9766676.1 glycosyltransferase family 2 protein [Ectothiorhodospiraceae bacterium]